MEMTKEIEKKGLLFSDELLGKIREKFCRIDTDYDGSRRLFFENAGGSLRLKAHTRSATSWMNFRTVS